VHGVDPLFFITPPSPRLTGSPDRVDVPVNDRDQIQNPLSHSDVRYVSCPHLVRLVDRLAAQKVRVDLVFGMPLAGVPLRPDRP